MLVKDLETAEDFQARLDDYAQAHGHTEGAYSEQPFEVRITLTRPLAGYDDTHLDALVQLGVVIDALEGRQLPPKSAPYRISLPLQILWRSSEGHPLYNSSNLTPSGDALKGTHWWVKRTGDEAYLTVTSRKKDGGLWQPDTGAGVNKAYMVPLPTTATREIVGYAVGDLQEVARLLDLAVSVGIGKKRAWGFGEVVSVGVTPCANVTPYLLGDHVTRPIPLAALPALGLVSREGQQMGFTPPYWLPAMHAKCVPAHSEVHVRGAWGGASSEMDGLDTTVRSVSEFLVLCEREDFARRVRDGGEPFDLTLTHPKYRAGEGIGEIDALTGHVIKGDGAVPAKDVFTTTLGNAVDYLKAPDSPWVSPASAIVMGEPKKWHRNMIALRDKEGSGVLLWPTLAVDPTNPTQERPLWREVFLDLQNKYEEYEVVMVFTSDPKSRNWPRARLGTVGQKTPVYVHDPDLGIAALLEFNAQAIVPMMTFVEGLLDLGFGRNAIRDSLPANTQQMLKVGVQKTMAYERTLVEMRKDPGFVLAWRVARIAEDRAKRAS